MYCMIQVFLDNVPVKFSFFFSFSSLSVAPEILNYDPITTATDMWQVVYVNSFCWGGQDQLTIWVPDPDSAAVLSGLQEYCYVGWAEQTRGELGEEGVLRI